MPTPEHWMFVFDNDNNDAIIERIRVGSNFLENRKLEKELANKYKDRNVNIKDGYLGVDEKLFNETRAMLENIRRQHPDVVKEVYVKDHPEFLHLGYELHPQKRHHRKRHKKKINGH